MMAIRHFRRTAIKVVSVSCRTIAKGTTHAKREQAGVELNGGNEIGKRWFFRAVGFAHGTV